MLIAIYIDEPAATFWEQEVYFSKKLIATWAEANPQDQFRILLTGEHLGFFAIVTRNLQVVDISIAPGLLYQWRLERAIKKHLSGVKPACLVLFGRHFTNRLAIPQVTFLFSLPTQWEKRKFSESELLFLPSEALKQRIAQKQIGKRTNLRVFYGAAEDPYVIDEKRRNEVKDQYAGGMEYLLFNNDSASADDVIFLLKAFSFFKRRQKTSMKMLLAGKAADPAAVDKLLQHYKFKEDVVLLSTMGAPSRMHLLASAYAFVESFRSTSMLLTMQAMAASVPVLVPSTSVLTELIPHYSASFDPLTTQELSERMMMVYKDEGWRENLIEQGKHLARKHSIKDIATAMWNEIKSLWVK